MPTYPENTAYWEIDPETEEVQDIGSYTDWSEQGSSGAYKPGKIS